MGAQPLTDTHEERRGATTGILIVYNYASVRIYASVFKINKFDFRSPTLSAAQRSRLDVCWDVQSKGRSRTELQMCLGNLGCSSRLSEQSNGCNN